MFTGAFFGVTAFPGIGWKQWVTCLVLAFVELPLAYIISLIPVGQPKFAGEELNKDEKDKLKELKKKRKIEMIAIDVD